MSHDTTPGRGHVIFRLTAFRPSTADDCSDSVSVLIHDRATLQRVERLLSELGFKVDVERVVRTVLRDEIPTEMEEDGGEEATS